MRSTNRFSGGIFSFLLLLGNGLFMLFLSWRRWPDVLVDFGRELYLPWQLTKGKVLYKDIFHIYGPFSHYFNSWLFRIFGVSLNTLIFFNIGMIVGLTFLIYKIFSALTDRLTALIGGITFLSIFSFSQYVGIGNYNFVCPYSSEITQGIFLSFLSLYLFIKYLRKERFCLLGIMGFILGVVFLTKVEVFLALSISEILGLIFLGIKNKLNLFKLIKVLTTFLIWAFVPILGFFIYFSLHTSLKEGFSFLTYQYRLLLNSPISSNVFYKTVLGTDKIWFNVSKIFIVLRWYILILGGFVFLGFALKSFSNKKIKLIFVISLLSLVAFFSSILIKKNFWLEAIRPLGVVILGCLIYNSFLFGKSKKKNYHSLFFVILSLFSLLLLLKMFFNIHVFHYGFALSLSSVLILIALVVYYLPNFLETLFGHKSILRVFAIILVTLGVLAHINWCSRIYLLKNQPVGGGEDLMLGFDFKVSPKARFIDIALKKIKEVVKEDESFVVFPEGVILNYLSRRDNPIPYFEFTPPMIELIGEDKIISALKKTKPHYIVLVHKNTQEHGFRFFGKDYGRKIFFWIKKNYQPFFQIGSVPLKDERFGILLEKIKLSQ